jgi:hypothetical protein
MYIKFQTEISHAVEHPKMHTTYRNDPSQNLSTQGKEESVGDLSFFLSHLE